MVGKYEGNVFFAIFWNSIWPWIIFFANGRFSYFCKDGIIPNG